MPNGLQELRLQHQAASPESRAGEERLLVLIVDDDERIRTASQELMLSVGIDSACFAATRELLDCTYPISPGALFSTYACPDRAGLIFRTTWRRPGMPSPSFF
jgi:FixJ family two-component response regulator